MIYRYSVLTYNFGNHDSFKEPEEVDPECEYVYVTDNPNIKSKIWKVILFDREKKNKSIYNAFYVRYHPQRFVSTNIVVTIDASVQLHRSLCPIINSFLSSGAEIGAMIYYRKVTCLENLTRWFRNNAKISSRAIDRNTFTKARNYIIKNFSVNYKGYCEAGFQIRKLNPTVINFQNKVWKDLLELGDKKTPLRIDEIVLSIKLQTEFKNVPLFKFCKQILYSSFATLKNHAGGKTTPITVEPNNIYFYNKLQKVAFFQ